MRAAFDGMGPWSSSSIPDAADDQEDELNSKRYRAIFISDLHLRTPVVRLAHCWIF